MILSALENVTVKSPTVSVLLPVNISVITGPSADVKDTSVVAGPSMDVADTSVVKSVCVSDGHSLVSVVKGPSEDISVVADQSPDVADTSVVKSVVVWGPGWGKMLVD